MKIVVTGALGHIGSEVIRKIPSKDGIWDIVMIDNIMTQRYCSLFNLPCSAKYRFVEADLLKIDLRPFFKNAEVVIHLAAITDPAIRAKTEGRSEHKNYNMTARVAEACSDAGCKMIHLSSTSVYGTNKQIVDEDCPDEDICPQSPYAENKLKEEKYLQRLGLRGKLHFITFRFGTICGVSRGMRFHTAVNKFCWQAVMGEPLTVWRTALHQKRPYLDLGDAIAAMKFVIRRDLFDNRVYNVLTQNLTVHSILNAIRKHIPRFDIEYVDAAIMNRLSYDVSARRLKDLGFKFRGDIGNRIGETVALLKAAYV